MGDIRRLIEKANQVFDQEEMIKTEEKMREGKFTLDTFLATMKQMKKLGPMREVMKLIPGMGGAVDAKGEMNPDEDMKQVEGIIQSMTPHERQNPDLIDLSRRERIAKGAGVDPSDVVRLLKDFNGIAGMMTQKANFSVWEQIKSAKQKKMSQARKINPELN